jgi:hypothetical protein
MSNKRTDTENLHALCDALSDSVVRASDEEVIEESRLVGRDPTGEARRLKALMLASVKTYQQRALRDARKAYDAGKQRSFQRSSIPETPTERRDLFSFVLAKQPQYSELLTAQHRQLTDLTDEDIETYLEDLDELGILEKLKPDTDDRNK